MATGRGGVKNCCDFEWAKITCTVILNFKLNVIFHSKSSLLQFLRTRSIFNFPKAFDSLLQNTFDSGNARNECR